MRIIIDAMGGDKAPEEIVKGAVMARRQLGVDVTLVGRREDVEACLKKEGCNDIDIADAREVITMEDEPSTATRRKKDSSMAVALNLLRDGAAAPGRFSPGPRSPSSASGAFAGRRWPPSFPPESTASC